MWGGGIVGVELGNWEGNSMESGKERMEEEDDSGGRLMDEKTGRSVGQQEKKE